MKGRLLAGLLLASLSAGGQAGIGPAGAAILAKIKSHDPAVRAEGQRELAASPALLKNVAMGRSLADVMIADMKRARRAIRGEAPPLTEQRAELYSDLLGIVARAYGYRDPHIRRALVFGAYDPGSKFAYDLAGQGASVLPDALSLARDPIDLWRAQATGIFGYMLMRRREGRLKFPISAAQAAAIHAQLRAFARSGDSVERYTAVQALGFGGDAEDLSLLRHVAATDPSCAKFPKAMNICWQALQAIKKIEARAKPRPRGVR